jgi:signal peptidase II
MFLQEDRVREARAGPKTASGADVRTKLTIFGILFPLVIALDWISKRWALEALANNHRIDLAGGLIPLSLAFNKGAAFGISVGDDSRWLFVPVTVVALFLLVYLFRQASVEDRLRLVSLSLILSGAVGNLYDRLRWSRGVVDFIGPIDLGFWDFPIFTVADMSISCGAILLAWSFWMEDRAERRMQVAAQEAVAEGEGGD